MKLMILRTTRKAFATSVMLVVLLHVSLASASGKSPLDAFPAPEDGMQRFVIELPDKARGEEDRFKVELVAGKQILTDGINVYRLANTIEPQSLQGWGYTYYEVSGSGEVLGTLMAPPEGTPMVERFVTGESILVRYNSRLPIVVYAPIDYQVRYRIWRASETYTEAGTH